MLRLCACKTYGKPTRPHLNPEYVFTPAKPRNPHARVLSLYDGVAHDTFARTIKNTHLANYIVRFGSSKQTNQLYSNGAWVRSDTHALHPRTVIFSRTDFTANCNPAKSEIWLSRKRTPDKRNALRTNFHTSSQEVKTTPKTKHTNQNTHTKIQQKITNLLCYSLSSSLRFAVRTLTLTQSDPRDGASTRTRTQRPASLNANPKRNTNAKIHN